MAPRKVKDRRGAIDAKDEAVSEATSSPLGDDASQKKKRGRPRKSAGAAAAAAFAEEDEEGEEEEEEEEGEASNNEEELVGEESPAIAKAEEALLLDANMEQMKREVMVMKKKTLRRGSHQSGKDGLDLQNDHLIIKCYGRKNHRRKGKPMRAAQASF